MRIAMSNVLALAFWRDFRFLAGGFTSRNFLAGNRRVAGRCVDLGISAAEAALVLDTSHIDPGFRRWLVDVPGSTHPVSPGEENLAGSDVRA